MHIRFNENIVKNKKKRTILFILLILFPLIFGLGMYWLSSVYPEIYSTIGKEDHLIEWLQFFLFLASGILSFILALRFKKISKIMFVLFLILSLGLIFVAGEEISWGQRIFNIEGHQVFDGETEIPLLGENVQSETNLHNFRTFHNMVGPMYILIGAYACFGWFLFCMSEKIFKPKKEITRFFPFLVAPPYLFFYFAPLGINLLPRRELGIAPQEYEMVEFLLSLGTFLCLLIFLKYFKKKFESQEA